MTAVAPSSPVAGQPAPRLQKAFGRASEEPYRRRPSDVVRLVAAAAVLIVLVLQATNPPDATQVDVLLLFRSLPRGLVPLLRGLEDIGTLWMVGLLGAATLLARRWRLSRDLALSGSLAWAVSRVLGPDVVGRVGLGASLRALAHFGTTPNFPLVRLAVAVAVFATAAPYVSRPTRWLGAALVAILVVAGLYLGTSYPIDILGGLAVGWGIAAAVHLIFGSPGGRPSSGQIEAALRQIGIKARAVRLAREQSAGGTIFEGEDQVGPLVVKVIGRDDVDGQLLSKTWRSVAYKEPSPPLQLSRAHQVEHEACMTLLAGSAGVNVPEVVFVGEAGPGAGVLVTRPLGGQRLGELEAAAVSDDLLAGVWRMVAKLHTAGVAHGALDAGHVVVGNDGPGVVSFATATTADFGLRHAKDTAELLASTAHMVGDERAVAACIEGLGVPALVSAIPLIQPAALRPQTRSALSSHHRGVQKRVDELRNAAAAAAGVKAPELQKLQRFRPASVIMAASSLVAIAVLLDRVGPAANLWHIARHLQWDWAAVAVAVSLATNVPGAVAVMGTLPLRLPLWPTIELQLAMSYTNLVVPVVGGTALQIRFLQRQGSDLPTALAAGGLLSIVGSVLTRVPLFALAVALSPHELHLGNISPSKILQFVLLSIFVLGALAGLVLGVPRWRRLALPPLKEAGMTVWGALCSPRQLSLMVAGNLFVAFLYGLCLLSCLHAFGVTLSFWSVLAINIGIGTLASLVPVPGGGTALGAVGLSAALAGLGVPTEVAVATTLANQLAVGYLPALPGFFATRDLAQHSHI